MKRWLLLFLLFPLFATAQTPVSPVGPKSNQTYLDNVGALWFFVNNTWFPLTGGGGGSVANPTASIGFTAVNGTATSAIRSDGAPKADSTVIRSVANSLTKAQVQTGLNTKQNTGNYITALTGDVTASGPGSVAATLANTAVTAGSYTNTNLTVDAKGRITAAANGNNGTVTSIATSTGITGGTITSTGTLKADTSVLQTVANFFPKGDTRYAKIGGGSLTNALTFGTGLVSGSYNNSTPVTEKVDTAVIQTVLNFFPKGDTRYYKSSNPSGFISTISGISAGGDLTGTYANPTFNLGLSHSWTAAQTINIASIAATQTNGSNLINSTLSTSGAATQISPAEHFQGHVWNTTATAADNFADWRIYANVSTAAQPTTTLTWQSSISATGTPSYTTNMTLDVSGNLVVGSVLANQLVSTPAILSTAFNNTLSVQSRAFTAATTAVNMATGAVTNSTGQYIGVSITSPYTQTSTAGATDFLINRTETSVGSGPQLLSDYQVAGSSKFKVDHNGLLGFGGTFGTANQVPVVNAGGTAMTWIKTAAIQASADLTAQTAAGNVTTFTVGSSTATFDISTYINVTAVSVDVIQGQITYTDENNTAQTISLANISAIGNSTYSPITIRAKNATVITVKTNLTTGAGSITFDTGARITQL